MPTPETRARHRNQVLEAAYTLFKENGIAATTGSMIARRAHVSMASFGRYFKSRDDLVRSVAEWSYHNADYKKTLAVFPLDDPAETGYTLLGHYMHAVAEHFLADPAAYVVRAEYMVYVRHSGMDAHACYQGLDEALDAHALLVSIFTRGAADGTLCFSNTAERETAYFCDFYYGFLSTLALRMDSDGTDAPACLDDYIVRVLNSYQKERPVSVQDFAAQAGREELSRILTNIPVGIVVYQYVLGEYQIINVNPVVYRLIGITPEQGGNLTADHILDYIDERDWEAVRAAMMHLRRPGENRSCEFRVCTGSGERWLAAYGRSVFDPSGATYIYVGYSDITGQKQASRMQMELDATQRANQAKTEFFSRMSHDMRTPMNGILGLTDLSLNETDPAVLHDNIVKIHSSGEYLLGLINDTLDFQKIESGRMVLEPRITSTKELIDGSVNMIRETAEKKGITFRLINRDADLEHYIYADPMRLKQIFVNLLSNAVKFTPPGGTVELTFAVLSRENGMARDKITVSDTGIGMSRNFLRNGIFKPFSQEDNSITSSTSGTGLGLSIAKQLTELMGGRIEVESELGEGTTFSVYLAFEIVPEQKARAQLHKAAVMRADTMETLKGRHILICEDHPLNAEIARRQLEAAGCTTSWAQNGQLALEMFHTAAPGMFDAILMDIRMPVMDGLTATRALRALPRPDAKTVPILAMSANAYAADVAKSLAAGMNAHLAKPIVPKQMYAALADAIAKAEA